MEKLRLDQKESLKIYCFSLKAQNVFDAPKVPTDAKFFLGYSTEGVYEEVAKRYGPIGLDIKIHADMPFKDMMEKVELPQNEAPVIPLPAPTPEYNRMQFVNGLRLVMDRFLDSPEDVVALKGIISRANFERSEKKN